MLDSYIRLHGKRLYGLCRSLCADPSDADDLYQDTWLKALNHFSQYDPSQPFEPWLTKICVNTYRNALRRLVRSPIFNGFASSQEKSALLERSAAPEPPDYSDLHCAIDALPERLRTTVILYYFQDMDIQAVSQAMNIPPGTVKSRLSRARTLLKEVLTHEGGL